ncbi:MAG: SsrA-binding protein SmpB [Proteobacteria bacterium]|nr:SsrA-binding protein SmpB [Pseudomonadota bacterium]
MSKKKKKTPTNIIAINKRAGYEYTFLEDFEAGLSLLGWEVKSLRQGKVQFNESYVFIRKHQAELIGTHITPLLSASTHVNTEPMRPRKLLLHRKEIARLIGAIERKGLTVVPRKLYWKSGKIKMKISLAKGKNIHDKRQTEKARDWDRNKHRILKTNR